MWKNFEGPDRSQMIIGRVQIECCITKATDTHSEYVIINAFPLQQSLHERASMLRYTYTTYFWLSAPVTCVLLVPTAK